MAFAQTTFFGASIRSFTTSLGWGGQSSQLTIQLVVDPSNGDAFAPPNVGSPVYFLFENWTFNGLLQNWTKKRGIGGDPLYETVVTDPREILEGVQLIIDNYTGSTFSVPNLYNIYGALESESFGNADVNNTGMKWADIANTFVTLGSTTPMQFKGNTFGIDLTALPIIPTGYRIGGNNISVLDFVTEVCTAGAHDFFFSLELVNGANIITLHTINRAAEVTNFGRITAYVSGVDGATTLQSGIELRNETTSKFVTGGQQAQVYFQFKGDNDTEDDFTDDLIWPFWGFDKNNNVNIGTGDFESTSFDAHKVKLDARLVNVDGVGETYETDVEEMLYVLNSQESWEAMLSMKSGLEDSIHAGKSKRFNINSTLREDILKFIEEADDVKALTILDFMDFRKKTIEEKKHAKETSHSANIKRLYDWLYTYASELYGKQFMVRIPFVLSKLDDGTNEIVTSVDPTDSGFIEEDAWLGAVGNNLMPEDVNFVTTSDGRIVAYVKFDDGPGLNISELNDTDYVFSKNSVFIKAELDPQIVFLNINNRTSPRVIIKMPGSIVHETEERGRDYLGLLKSIFKEKGIIDADAAKIFPRAGSEALFFGREGVAAIPNMTASPLVSNVLTYGPWFAIGAEGKVEFEQDESLVPWNYGGFVGMNVAGNAKVSSALSNQQLSETGSIEVPGAPSTQLGSQLINNGPYVTNISVSIGPNGVTTAYQMKTWSASFGKITKQAIESARKNALLMQQNRRKFRELGKLPTKKDIAARGARRNKRDGIAGTTPKSSHNFLFGEIIDKGSSKYSSSVVSAPLYDIQGRLATDFENKAMMSMDGLFRPFTDDTSSTTVPHYVTPTESGAPNVTTLNPIQDGHDIDFVLRGDSLPSSDGDSLADVSSGPYRGFGLRTPTVLIGWGYDTDGKPVPNENPSSPTDNFASGYLEKQQLWKAGPLDARWNHARGVWEASGGSKIHTFTITGSGTDAYIGNDGTTVLSSGVATDDDDSGAESYIKDTSGRNFLLTGEKVLCAQVGTTWKIVGENGLERRVTTDSGITAGGSAGACTIQADDITTTKKIEVFLNWMDGNENISADKEAWATYLPSDAKWRFTGADCE